MPLVRQYLSVAQTIWLASLPPSRCLVRCAYMRDVDVAGFLLNICVHSPGTTRVLLANLIIVSFQTQKPKLNLLRS